MTRYGTIPASTPPAQPEPLQPSKGAFISRAKHLIGWGLGTPQLWTEIVSPLSAFSLPSSANAAAAALFYANASYFRVNYAMIVSVTLILSLLIHSTSLAFFVLLVAAWLYLYFLRKGPLVVFHQPVDDVVVLGGLCMVTYMMLFLTAVTGDVAVGMVVGLGLVAVHGALKRTEAMVAQADNSSSSSSSSSSASMA